MYNQENDNKCAFGQKLYPILHHNCLSPSLSKSLLNICILIDNRILAYLHFRSISFHFNFQEDEPRLLGIFLDSYYSLIDVSFVFISFVAKHSLSSEVTRRLLSGWWAIVASSCDSLIILIRDLNRKRQSRLLLHRRWFFLYTARSKQSQLSIRDYHSSLICTSSFPRRFIRQGAKFLSRTVSLLKIIERGAHDCFSGCNKLLVWPTMNYSAHHSPISPSRLMRLSISIFYIAAPVSRYNKKLPYTDKEARRISNHLDRRFPARLLSSAWQIDVAIL